MTFNLGFGGFHLCMNYIYVVVETHRGTINQLGSFTHLFAILEKTRLGGEHPDYHTLLAAMTQILHGLLLNLWRKECGHPTLKEFSDSNPSPRAILDMAHVIMEKYTIPKPSFPPTNSKAPPKDLDINLDTSHPNTAPIAVNDSSGSSAANTPPSNSDDKSDEDQEDIVHRNVILLTRDLLYVTELVEAMSSGDFGRIEDILPTLACMFRGAGSNNYSTEILHLLFNFKEVWTPEFA